MNHTAIDSSNLSDARWISIRPHADERRQTLAEAKWVGPATTPTPEPDNLFAIGVQFEIPSNKKVVSAVLEFWLDGRSYWDDTFTSKQSMDETASWAAIRINERNVDAATRILGTQAVRSLAAGDYLCGGTNRLALLSWASLPSPSAIAALELRFDDGSVQRISSGQAWRSCALTLAEAREKNWEAKLHDSKACVEYGAFGAEPWDDQRARLNHPMPPVVLRRTFELPDRPVASATVTATAIGVYDMEINGRRVGDDYLAPGWTDQLKAVRVQTYDAADLLVPGANVWSATVAKGWTGSPMLGCEPKREDEKSFRAQLIVRYADGETIRILTDAEGWEGCTAQVRDSEIYDGETVDMTYQPHWRPAVILPDRDIALVPETGTLARIVREFPPLRIVARGERTWIVDFGQNCTGVVRLELDEPRGTRIVVRHAEDVRKDGGLMTGSLKRAACTDRVVCPGGPFVFQPRFTFRGFRYIEIAGISSAPKTEQLRKIALSSVTRQTLELDFAHPRFDRLFEMIRWTQLSNWLSVPMDGPQRGERLGWLGDNQLFAPSGLTLFDGRLFQSKHIDDLFHEAHENGTPPDMAPCGSGAPPLATYGWADGAVVVPHTIWKIYGDLDPARRHWAAIRKYLFSLDASSDADGLVVHGVYGDWLTTEPMTPHPIMAPLWQAQAHRLGSQLAQALGDDAAAAFHSRRHEEIGDVWRRRHLRKDGTIDSEAQGVYVCAWHAGLIPEMMKPAVSRALRAAFARWNNHPRTGLLSTAHLLEVLAEAGLLDVAWHVLSTDDFPSHGYFLKKGATTIPEWWDAWPDGNEITSYWEKFDGEREQGELPGSLNHPAFCSILDGIVKYVWGLRQAPDSSGYEDVIIAPLFTDKLERLSGRFHSVRGDYALAWRRESDGVRFEIEIPRGCRAKLMPLQSDCRTVTLEGGWTSIKLPTRPMS